MRSRLLVVLALGACGGGNKGMDIDAGVDAGDDWPAGALTQATLTSSVGVLLDEIPMPQRAAVATQLMAKPASFWSDRAKRQAKLTGVRLVFRANYYDDPKDSLPIAP